MTVGVTKKLIEAGLLDPTLTTVVLNTGDGLKTLDAVAPTSPGRPPPSARAWTRSATLASPTETRALPRLPTERLQPP